jgi:hypothetical protein
VVQTAVKIMADNSPFANRRAALILVFDFIFCSFIRSCRDAAVHL